MIFCYKTIKMSNKQTIQHGERKRLKKNVIIEHIHIWPIFSTPKCVYAYMTICVFSMGRNLKHNFFVGMFVYIFYPLVFT